MAKKIISFFQMIIKETNFSQKTSDRVVWGSNLGIKATLGMLVSIIMVFILTIDQTILHWPMERATYPLILIKVRRLINIHMVSTKENESFFCFCR